MIGALLIPVGLFSYMFYLWCLTGDAFAFVHIQKAWGRENVGVIKTLWNALSKGILTSHFYWACWAIGGFALVGYLFTQKRYEEGVWGLICLLIPLQSQEMSISRFMVGDFVFCLAGVDIMQHMCARFQKVILFLLPIMNIVLVCLWYMENGLVV